MNERVFSLIISLPDDRSETVEMKIVDGVPYYNSLPLPNYGKSLKELLPELDDYYEYCLDRMGPADALLELWTYSLPDIDDDPVIGDGLAITIVGFIFKRALQDPDFSFVQTPILDPGEMSYGSTCIDLPTTGSELGGWDAEENLCSLFGITSLNVAPDCSE